MDFSEKLKFRSKNRQRNEIVLQDLANEITLNVKPKRGNSNFNSTQSQTETVVFNHILDDVWFNIADHLNPEDVGTFALICRQSANVVACAIFWKKLYRRFCKDTKKLPDNLRSRCENQIGSIRSNVICALFHLYPPFIARIKKGYEMSSVHGYGCNYNWYWKTGPYWFFCYKLWNKTKTRKPKEEEIEDSDEDDEYGLNSILNKLNNVFENPDEGIYLLLVITNKFIPLPELRTAMILHSTRQLLNSDLRNTNVELTFLPENQQQTSKLSVDILYTSCKHRVIPWWHPDFERVQLLYKKQEKENHLLVQRYTEGYLCDSRLTDRL
ncbi:transmembrane protein 183 isoform X2 [Episyrphus balteatus]|uniref:transmembrane protein 183 isoform X2 n=1 Tax=Episyrphus balteatus TaxID=286459 RepID=UPI002484E91B|nr:transmembrane protein 183 isoform X2 [Episyrphus balteatus]